jgi:hypothetical protein
LDFPISEGNLAPHVLKYLLKRKRWVCLYLKSILEVQFTQLLTSLISRENAWVKAKHYSPFKEVQDSSVRKLRTLQEITGPASANSSMIIIYVSWIHAAMMIIKNK